MNKIYVIKDKNKANFHKFHVGLFKDPQRAESKFNSMKNKMTVSEQKMLSLDSIPVADYDPNKNSVYFVFNKANPENVVVGVYYDLQKAYAKVTEVKNKVPAHQKEMVKMKCEVLEG